jgi:hypothetical protein
MSTLCSVCIPAAEITDITPVTTKVRLNEIQKFIIQRTKNGTTRNEITISAANPNLLATWTALKAASDSTKVQVSPYIDGPESEAGGPREFGGPGETRGGIPRRNGRENTPFSARLFDMPQSVIEELKNLECETELSVFLINECGNIIGKTDDTTTPTIFYGFPIREFFVSDLNMGQYTQSDSNMIQWNFQANWSDKLHVVTPSDFDALVEL